MGSYKSAGAIPPGGVKPVYSEFISIVLRFLNEKLNIDALKFLSAVIAFFQNSHCLPRRTVQPYRMVLIS